MNRLIIILSFVINSNVFAEQVDMPHFDKGSSFAVEIYGKKFLLTPYSNGEMSSSGFPDRKSPIACDGALFCYKCCTGHNSVTEAFCKYNFNNWKRGSDCNCDR